MPCFIRHINDQRVNCLRKKGPQSFPAVRSAAVIVLMSYVFLGHRAGAADDTGAAKPVPVRDVFLRVKDEVVLPALERGQLKQFAAEPGDEVTAGQIVAVLDDVEAELTLELTRIELEIAEKQYQDSVAVLIQKAALEEGRMLVEQARAEADVTKAMADNDIAIKQAESDGALSRQELERAVAAREAFSSSVSEQQLAKLTLTRDRDLLALDLARHQKAVENLRCRSKESLVQQQQSAVRRLEHILSKTESEHATEEIKLRSLSKQVAIAEEHLERRRLRAPFAGMVVEKLLSAGEWAETGKGVLRIVRLDVLHAEGYVDAKQITPRFRGRKVIVTCDDNGTTQRIEGRIVFVSPEIEPVSKQVQIRAEIANPNFTLRPGLPVEMVIVP